MTTRASTVVTLLLLVVACVEPVTPTSTTVDAGQATTPTTTTTTPPPIAGDTVVFRGGPVLTMDPNRPVASAVVVEGDRIAWVGDESEVDPVVGPDAVQIDLGGMTLLPGFIDTHTHRVGDRDRFGYPDADTAIEDALSQGWTSIDELYVNQERLDELRALDAAGGLRIRVNAYLPLTTPQGESLGDWYTAYMPGQVFSPMLRIGGLKLFPDSNSGRTLHYSQDQLDALVATLHDEGWQLAIKAISTQTHEQVLTALANVLGSGPNTQRHRIEHALAITEEQVGQLADLGIIVAIQPHYPGALQGDVDIESLIVEQGQDNFARWRSLADAGVPLSAGYAFPNGYDQDILDIPPPGSPLRLLYRSVTQTTGVDDPPPAWMLTHALTFDETLRALTLGSAYADGTDDRVGSIVEGKLADLVIVSADLLETTSGELAGLEVLMTMVGGGVEFCATGSEALCPGSVGAPQSEVLVTASASRDGHGTDLAFDGSTDENSFWSSGDDPPGWLQVAYPEPTVVTAIRFVVYQNPPSETRHELELIIDGSPSLVATFEAFTTTGDVIEWRPAEPTAIDGFRITTVSSASWPEWLEIEVDVIEVETG